MATIVVQQRPSTLRHSVTPPPMTPALTFNPPRSTTPIPNKHLPFCPPGPTPSSASQIVTPPNSPPTRSPIPKPISVLHPPNHHRRLCSSPLIYGIEATSLSTALSQAASQPLLDPSHVFPWLHGLHPENHIQLAFFVGSGGSTQQQRRRSLQRRTPRLLRGITVIKAGGDLTRSRIRGAIAPDEIISLCDDNGSGRGFVESDPREGFSVRNFHIQAAKMATVSDIVVYGDDKTDARVIKSVAERAANVQRRWRKELEATGQGGGETFHTFVLTDGWDVVEEKCPEIVAVDSRGRGCEGSTDFLAWERREMCEMSKASEISSGVWLGPSPVVESVSDRDFDVLIEASDHAGMVDKEMLKEKAKLIGKRSEPLSVMFPSSGSILPPSWSQKEVDGLMGMCRWIWDVTHGMELEEATTREEKEVRVVAMEDQDGDIQMTELSPKTHQPQPQRRVLIHCADGYTESSLLAVAYFMFAENVPVHEAWLRLHLEKKRNFFAYPSDVALLISIQARILRESPAMEAKTQTVPAEISMSSPLPHTPMEPLTPQLSASAETSPAPAWLAKLDGSLPSRILPYMYLGNLGHANNPGLLWEMGVRRVLSVGEPVNWSKEERERWGSGNVVFVDRVQDNGIDELRGEFERCLDFIAKGKKDGTATLVHCRVGVSRSATICIAEVMASLGLSFPRAYCFVRARRLNVIIQPHLRFVYELLKWEEYLKGKKGFANGSREMEWASVCREIAGLNRPYARG